MIERYTAEQLVALAYILVMLGVTLCLARGHRQGKINLWEVVTATDRTGTVRTDGRKLFEAVTFVAMTATFIVLTVTGKLTEWYALIHVGSWVAARGWRDFAQVLHTKTLVNGGTNDEGR